MVCLAPRALGDIVRPRRSSDVVVRPLNLTVSVQGCALLHSGYETHLGS